MMTYFFTGYHIVSVASESAADFLELCRCQGFVYDGFAACEDGSVSLRMKSATARRALALAEAQAMSVKEIKIGGLPKLLRRALHRPGLWIGGLLAVLLLVVSTRFVWDVRVTGNQHLTEREVKDALRACDFGVGSYLGNFKADRTENRVLIQHKKIAWISINMRGTVAYVQIREAVDPPKTADTSPANLVADIGGQIMHLELIRGQVVVTAGQWVDQGDLLISGVYDGEQSGLRYTHAEGRVYARVVEEIAITIPMKYEKKVYNTEKEDIFCEKFLIFFENPIKFSEKLFNSKENCDIIKKVSVPFSKTGRDFPIGMVTQWYIPYTVKEETRTYAEAEALAYLELAQRIGSLQGGAEVLSKTITTTLGEDVYVLTCTLTCIRDIAKEQTFEVLP